MSTELIQHLQEENLMLREQLAQEHAKAAWTYREAVKLACDEALGELKHELRALKARTPGEKFAEAGNALVKGIMSIQFLVHRPVADGDIGFLLGQRDRIAAICEELVGPYKIIIADLSRETTMTPTEGA